MSFYTRVVTSVFIPVTTNVIKMYADVYVRVRKMVKYVHGYAKSSTKRNTLTKKTKYVAEQPIVTKTLPCLRYE